MLKNLTDYLSPESEKGNFPCSGPSVQAKHKGTDVFFSCPFQKLSSPWSNTIQFQYYVN
jgi:hypothetical protein